MNLRRAQWTVLFLPVLATYATPLRPPRPVPLFVTNTTCTPGPCRPIRILGFPLHKVHVPNGGWKIDLGTVTTATACLTIPATTVFRVTEQPSGRSGTTLWTSRDSFALASRPPGVEVFSAFAMTQDFVPENARAWRVALPGDSTDTAVARVRPMKGRVRC